MAAPVLLPLGLRGDYLINNAAVPGESLSFQRERAPVPRRCTHVVSFFHYLEHTGLN